MGNCAQFHLGFPFVCLICYACPSLVLNICLGITSAHGIIAAMKDVKVHAPVVSQPAPPSIQRSSVQQPQPKLGFFQKLKVYKYAYELFY